jgi:D-alanine--poly(phosphoribitol) ligase subunit 2
MRNRDEIEKYVVSLLSKKAPLPDNVDLGRFRYLDAGQVDSLGLTKFIFELEDRFGIEFNADDTQSDEFRTVGGLISLIEQKLQR